MNLLSYDKASPRITVPPVLAEVFQHIKPPLMPLQPESILFKPSHPLFAPAPAECRATGWLYAHARKLCTKPKQATLHGKAAQYRHKKTVRTQRVRTVF